MKVLIILHQILTLRRWDKKQDGLAPMRIDEQYARAKYNLFGAPFRQWPEKREWYQLYGKATHIIK